MINIVLSLSLWINKIQNHLKEGGALSSIILSNERAPPEGIPLHATSYVNCYFLCVIISMVMLFVVIVCN